MSPIIGCHKLQNQERSDCSHLSVFIFTENDGKHQNLLAS
jgi:hypothetical protein